MACELCVSLVRGVACELCVSLVRGVACELCVSRLIAPELCVSCQYLLDVALIIHPLFSLY